MCLVFAVSGCAAKFEYSAILSSLNCPTVVEEHSGVWTPRWANIISYYNFNNNIDDYSGSDNQAVENNGLFFRGTYCSSALRITPTNGDLQLGTGNARYFSRQMSVSAWVKRTYDWSNVANPIFWNKDVHWTNAIGWYFSIEGFQNRIVLITAGSRGIYAPMTPNDQFPLNQWVHIV